MIESRLVPVPKNAFAFCRYSLAILLWLAFFLRTTHPLVAEGALITCATILALSAILTVQRAPMVALYTHTIDRAYPSQKVMLDVNAMRFAHILGTVLVGLPVALLHAGQPRMAWSILFFVAIAKTAGAMGFCAASKLYACANGGGACCRFMRGGKSGCCG
jgi:hypothetical protein